MYSLNSYDTWEDDAPYKANVQTNKTDPHTPMAFSAKTSMPLFLEVACRNCSVEQDMKYNLKAQGPEVLLFCKHSITIWSSF